MSPVPRTRTALPGHLLPTGSHGCMVGMCSPMRKQGLITNPAKKAHNLIKIAGPGLLMSGHVTKQGGSSGLTFVNLKIDGKSVISLSYIAALNWGFTQSNPFGLVVLGHAGLLNFTFGWQAPLTFKSSLDLSVTVKETGVVQMVANVICGKSG